MGCCPARWRCGCWDCGCCICWRCGCWRCCVCWAWGCCDCGCRICWLWGLLRLWLSHLLALGLLRPWLLGLRLLHLLVLRLLGLLALLLWLLHLLALELLRLLVWLLALGLLRLLLWLLGLLSAGELATLPACGRLFLVFGRPTRRTQGALLLAGLLLTAPSCLSFLSLLTELVLVALITHSLSPVAVCRFATDGSNEGLDIGKPDSGTPGGRPPSRIGPSIPVGATRVVVKVMASVQQV